MQNRDVVIALTRSDRGETVYVSTPISVGKYRTRSCRLPEGEGRSVHQELVGALLCVAPVKPGPQPGNTVRCGATLFELVGDAAGLAVGKRLGAGGDARSVHVVSSPIIEIHTVDLDRSWVLEPMLRAYRNGDPAWRDLLTEDPACEQGDEGIADDETGSVSANAIDNFYRRRLEDKAARRLASASKRGFVLEPRHVLVSNDELGAALAAAAGEIEAGPSVLREHRRELEAGIDVMLATMLGIGMPAPARVVVIRDRDLEATLSEAAGPGMRLLDLRRGRGLRDRRAAGRVAEGLDRMLRTVKAWPDAIPEELPAAA